MEFRARGGLGHSLAREFNSRGCRVFATARLASSISNLESEGIETLSLEIHKSESIRQLTDQVQKLTGGKLDILVNNAGRNYIVPALELDYDEVQQTFEVNVFAVMRMCQAFAPMTLSARGMIVQIDSLAAMTPYIFSSPYNTSKAALRAYSNTLRVELTPFGVRVVTVVTGGVQSNIARTDRTLIEGSLYLPVEEEFQRRVKYSEEGAMLSAVYTRSVVEQIIKKPQKSVI